MLKAYLGYSMKLYGMPLFYAEIKRKEIIMCDSKALCLKFVGMDSWIGLFIRMIVERYGKM